MTVLYDTTVPPTDSQIELHKWLILRKKGILLRKKEARQKSCLGKHDFLAVVIHNPQRRGKLHHMDRTAEKAQIAAH